MAQTPRAAITRDQLASFLPNHDLIRRFEKLFATDEDTSSLVLLIEASQSDADSARSAATQAIDAIINLLASQVGYYSSLPGAKKRTVQEKLDEVVSVKDFGAVGDGAHDDTAAIQAAIDSSGDSTVVYLPAGTYVVSSAINLRSGTTLVGAGRFASVIQKSDFSGAALLGVDTDFVTLEEFSIEGPGGGVGFPNTNKGIDIHINVNQICKAPSLRNVSINGMNDVGIYMGSCAYASWSNVRVTDIGYCAIWIDGGDGHNLDACSTQYSLIGFLINKPSGFGPTTVTMQACYAEQAGRGVWFIGAVSCVASGCGVEAAINFDATHCGINWTISGGRSVTLLGCLSRNDTVGAALPITSPHVLVDASAENVLIDGFTRENHAVYPPPTYELDCQNATTVVLGRNNFTGGTILSNSKISTIDTTVVP